MYKVRNILIAVVVGALGIAGLSTHIFYQSPSLKCGYVLNKKIFDSYAGSKALNTRLEKLRVANKQTLDSVRGAAPAEYENMRLALARQEQVLSAEYSAQLWLRINEAIKAFGVDRGYDFIYGATGDGSLMYARETHDITDIVVAYLNKNYEGE